MKELGKELGYALLVGLRAGIRTLAQALAGGMASLAVADMAGFGAVPELATVLFYGAALTALAAFLMNFAESIKDDVDTNRAAATAESCCPEEL